MNMAPEYMAELHKFLYLSNDSDEARLHSKVTTHLKYIPHKKLYRYRKCTEREMEILKENSIWVSNPEKFPDMFDATIPMPDRKYIEFDYPFFFEFEVAYEVLKKMAEEGEEIPEKDDLLMSMYETMAKYSQEEINEKLIEIFGEEEYKKMRSQKLPDIDFSKGINRTKKFLDKLSASPRNSLAITSLTTRYDNRNMWENYAENYTGFCVEYNFAKGTSTTPLKSAWDILHLLPVKYYRKRPLFDYTDILQRLVRADMKLEEFDLDIDEFLAQYYRFVTAKLYDYRAEQEWRLVMKQEYRGKYSFPYANKIFLGKGMLDENVQKMKDIANSINVSVYIQTVSTDGNSFEYKQL